jgi:hypothetical protein
VRTRDGLDQHAVDARPLRRPGRRALGHEQELAPAALSYAQRDLTSREAPSRPGHPQVTRPPCHATPSMQRAVTAADRRHVAHSSR